MIWQDLIIIFVAMNLCMVMNHLDTMPGYSCPEYCDIDHMHYPLDEQIKPLDKQSDLEPLIAGNVK